MISNLITRRLAALLAGGALVVQLLGSPALAGSTGSARAHAHSHDGRAVAVAAYQDCYNCSGTGQCWNCSGTGRTVNGAKCYTCSGTGLCYYCGGKGVR